MDEAYFRDMMERKGYDVTPDCWPKIMAKMCDDSIRKGWVLTGGTGTGKTMRAAFARVATNMGRRKSPGIFIDMKTAASIARNIVAAHELGKLALYDAYNVSGDHLTPGVRFPGMDLIIDDLGVEQTNVKAFGTTIEPLREMLELRLEMFPQVKTYITTNLTPEEIAKRYGERVASRLAEACAWIRMDGPDRRKKDSGAFS